MRRGHPKEAHTKSKMVFFDNENFFQWGLEDRIIIVGKGKITGLGIPNQIIRISEDI